MKFLTKREIHVIGVQRTGQHAITSWLVGHFGDVLYKNCMSQLGRRKGKIEGFEPPFWLFSPDTDEYKEVGQFVRTPDAIIMGTEFTIFKVGINPKVQIEKELIAKENGFDKFSERQDYVIVVRNPYNQYASVLRWKKNKLLGNPVSFVDMWIRTAEEATKILNKEDNVFGPNGYVINYDMWFQSPSYRREIEKYLNLKESDIRINTVMKVGYEKSWGSSFDGMKKKQEGQSMDVLNRWERVKKDARFIEVCNNEKLQSLAKTFGYARPI
jgi:hypothetical protein